VLEPTPGLNLGYGQNILQRIREGHGQIMPSAPSRVNVVRVDLVALDVEAWLKSLERGQRYVVKLFYLSSNLTVEEKAQRLHISRRQLYNRIENLQLAYQQWLALQRVHSN
jgi:hypothetical protein